MAAMSSKTNAPPPPKNHFPTPPKPALNSRMKIWPPENHRRARHVRVPAFSPVPLRCRADGWTPQRQAEFLAALALTRSVCAAARKVGMARETAYRLRRRADAASFAAAWDAVLGRGLALRWKVTVEDRAQRAHYGLLKPLIYRGEHVGTVQQADNSALLGHIAQLDRALKGYTMMDEWSQSFTGTPVSTSRRRSSLSRRRSPAGYGPSG